MDKRGKTLIIFGGISLILVLLFGIFVVAESFNPEDERKIGYEFLDNNKVVHIWNTQDDYYFNKSSGIQFTNYYQDYWSRNIFCLGYYSGEEWIKIKCADELVDFNRNIETNNSTYVNATLWKNIEYGAYDIKLGVNYYLGLDDKNLFITIYGKNIGIDIPYDLGFAWKVTNLDVPPETTDRISINDTNYELDGTYDLTFKDMKKYVNVSFPTNQTTSNGSMIYNYSMIEIPIPFYKIYDHDGGLTGKENFLRIDWDEDLNYAVKMYGDGNQESFYTALLINAGHFNPQQEKSTTFYWIDAEWNVSTAEYLQPKDVSGQDNEPRGIFFKPDGTKMYVTGSQNDNVYEYDLDPAWNVSSASYLQLKNVSGQDSFPRGLFFKPDGTKMYFAGDTGNSIYEYDLDPAWNVSSASYQRLKDVSGQDTVVTDVFFKPDGTKMYFTGAGNKNVYEYDLIIPWNVTNASYLQPKDVGPQDPTLLGLFFKPDGTKMYVMGNTNTNVYEYNLSTPWNVTSATYLQPKDVGDEDAGPQSLFFNPDGTKMYFVGNQHDSAYEYDLPLVDTNPPTYSNAQTNTTIAGQSILFSILYNDDTALHPKGQYIFSTNNTGTWTNESAINFTATPQWVNVTKTLNLTGGMVVGYRWYADDNAGNWNNTPIYTLTTIDVIPPETTTPTIDPSNPTSSDDLECKATLTDNYETNLTANWTWYKNNITNLTGVKTDIVNGTPTIITTLLSGNTTKGEEWKCGVLPFDGINYGNESNSSSITILNSITFNVTDSFSSASLNSVTISCNSTGFDQRGDTTNPYGPYGFANGSYSCDFTEDNHYIKTITFIADTDKTVSVPMSEQAQITIEEHTWLEAIYNCVVLGDCSLYNLLLEINSTVGNIWDQTKPTDESVVISENIINKVVNSTHDLTIDYNISIPIKAGYSLGAYLPIRIGYWFLNESNTTCYNQGTKPESVEDPYCQPLIIETIGPMGGYVSFTVAMRPDLPEDEYTIKRIIDIDPNNVWTNYGQELIGTFRVTESIAGYGISVENTGEVMPEKGLLQNIKSGITGAVTGIGNYLLSGWQIVAIIGVIGGVLVVFIISRTILQLKKK